MTIFLGAIFYTNFSMKTLNLCKLHRFCTFSCTVFVLGGLGEYLCTIACQKTRERRTNVEHLCFKQIIVCD